MEKRAFIAIFVSFIIIVLFQMYIVPSGPKPGQAPQSQPAAPQTAPAPSQTPAAGLTPPPAPPALTGVEPPTGDHIIRIHTPLYDAGFTNRGARLRLLQLKQYRDSEGQELELVSEGAYEKGLLPFGVDPSGAAATAKEINGTLFACNRDSVQVGAGLTASLTFLGKLANGDWISKKFTFAGDSYDIQVEVRASPGLADIPLSLGAGLGNPSADQLKNSRIIRGSVVCLRAGKIERVQGKEIKVLGPVDWLGIEDNYFVLLARFPRATPAAVSAPLPDLNNLSTAYLQGLPTQAFTVYAGPKDYDQLKRLGSGMEKIVNYGWFGFLARPMLAALKLIYTQVHNYGTAIILLTLVIKLILFPLTYNSTVSMLKMQKLQPEMTAIRERFSKKKSIEDRQKMNTEIMKLYKDRGVNPMGGCIPLLIQMPVLIAFYNLLSASIELRHAPFIFWIHDLSLRDPYFVTPILMGVTQVLLQRMTPSPADPMQARMMMIMPIFFTMLFLNMQSGLVLYWTVNNLLSMLQQYAMARLGVVPARNSKPRDK